MRISVAGLGYVGLSLACLLSRQNQIYAVDICEDKVRNVNSGVSPIKDPLISKYLATRPPSLHATTDAIAAYAQSELIIIATPTNYDESTHRFDTSSIEKVLDLAINANPKACVAIKSTVPIGYTKSISKRYGQSTIMFSPEFLREGHALEDNLHPSRIVVGVTADEHRSDAERFAKLLSASAEDRAIPIRVVGSSEAEAIKLFANTFLALRVSFFNELDTYAQVNELDSRQIIDGVCLDPRIGDHYNNPSFGYGGYCLPKDSKQLLSNYDHVPENLIRAIVESNATRKRFIADSALKRQPQHVGIYRLIMKSGSDNFRQSSALDVIQRLLECGVSVTIYEPNITGRKAFGCSVCNNLSQFKASCDLILANRWDEELSDVAKKVFTRDLWKRD